MRQLTKAQKKLLDQQPKEVIDVDTLPPAVWKRLQEMNDTEILWQEVNRYLWDRYWEAK